MEISKCRSTSSKQTEVGLSSVNGAVEAAAAHEIKPLPIPLEITTRIPHKVNSAIEHSPRIHKCTSNYIETRCSRVCITDDYCYKHLPTSLAIHEISIHQQLSSKNIKQVSHLLDYWHNNATDENSYSIASTPSSECLSTTTLKFPTLLPLITKNIDLITISSYIKQILTILVDIHDIGIAHLDISPANLMMDENKRVVLIDFGLSLSLPHLYDIGVGSRIKSSPHSSIHTSITPSSAISSGTTTYSPTLYTLNYSQESYANGERYTAYKNHSIYPRTPVSLFSTLSNEKNQSIPDSNSVFNNRKNSHTTNFSLDDTHSATTYSDTYSIDSIRRNSDTSMPCTNPCESTYHFSGTPGYIAPEVHSGNASTPAADLYATGVTLGQWLEPYIPDCSLIYLGSALVTPSTTNYICRKLVESLDKRSMNTGYPQWPSAIYNAADLLSRMLEGNPGLRITARQALKHAFVVCKEEDFVGTDYKTYSEEHRRALCGIRKSSNANQNKIIYRYR